MAYPLGIIAQIGRRVNIFSQLLRNFVNFPRKTRIKNHQNRLKNQKLCDTIYEYAKGVGNITKNCILKISKLNKPAWLNVSERKGLIILFTKRYHREQEAEEASVPSAARRLCDGGYNKPLLKIKKLNKPA